MNSRAWSTAESATRTESVRMYVINPTGPSSPTSTPSYSCCAIRIVIAAEKPSCFAASCCSVLVRNGGGGGGGRAPVFFVVARRGSRRAAPPIGLGGGAPLLFLLWSPSFLRGWFAVRPLLFR